MPKKTIVPVAAAAAAAAAAATATSNHNGKQHHHHRADNKKKKYTLTSVVKESHGHPIYCVAFSRHVHALEEENATKVLACFATCGGSYATIYEVALSSKNGSGSNSNASQQRQSSSSSSTPPSLPPLSARQVYRDVDDGETFYTCAFGGRGVGSPVVDDDGDGSTEGDVIYFGAGDDDDDNDDATRSAKRQKRNNGVQPSNNNPKSLHATTTTTTTATQNLNGPPLLCLGGTRGIIKVIDTTRRSLHLTLSGHGNDITDLKFSPTNEWLLLSSSKDESIRLWNVYKGVNVAVFCGHNGHQGQVLSVSWHWGGRKFASCGMDNMVKLWRVLEDEDDDVEDEEVDGNEKKEE